MAHRIEVVINFENPVDFEAIDKMMQRGQEELLISEWWCEDYEGELKLSAQIIRCNCEQ